MINIGIIGTYEDKKIIKIIMEKNLENFINQYKITFLNNFNNINNINKDFEIIYINDLRYFNNNFNIIKNLIKNAKFVVLNIDLDENLRKLKNMNLHVITYGFNNKATITCSSASEDYIIIYIQRIMKNLYYKKIDSQEIKIYYEKETNSNLNTGKNKKKKAIDISNKNYYEEQCEKIKINVNLLMGIITILLICGKDNVKL